MWGSSGAATATTTASPPPTSTDSRAVRFDSSAARRGRTAPELVGDERLRRDRQRVQGEGEEEEQARRDLVGGEGRLVDPGGDRRRPDEDGEHRPDAQQQVPAGG